MEPFRFLALTYGGGLVIRLIMVFGIAATLSLAWDKAERTRVRTVIWFFVTLDAIGFLFLFAIAPIDDPVWTDPHAYGRYALAGFTYFLSWRIADYRAHQEKHYSTDTLNDIFGSPSDGHN